MKYCCTLC